MQSCNISNNKKYTLVDFLLQMSQVIFLSAANHPSKNESFEQNNIPIIKQKWIWMLLQ